MKGTFIVLGIFAAGCVAGWLGLLPVDPAEEKLTTYVLYAMMFLVGITIGSNPDLKKILKSISPKLLLLPLVSILGTLAFSAAASLLLGKWGAADCLAVGSGMAYYSLSSILISGYKEMAARRRARHHIPAHKHLQRDVHSRRRALPHKEALPFRDDRLRRSHSDGRVPARDTQIRRGRNAAGRRHQRHRLGLQRSNPRHVLLLPVTFPTGRQQY